MKAGFVLNIARFARWPLAGLEGREIPLCLLGEGSLDTVTELLEGHLVRGRTVAVHRIESVEQVTSCAIVFIGAAMDEQLPQICAAAESGSTLTMSDSDGFADRCVMINIVREGLRLTFEVNQRSALRARIQLSSELLKLGRLTDWHDG